MLMCVLSMSFYVVYTTPGSGSAQEQILRDCLQAQKLSTSALPINLYMYHVHRLTLLQAHDSKGGSMWREQLYDVLFYMLKRKCQQ